MYPYSGSTLCPDIIAGTQLWSTQTKTTLNYLVRHCDGSYNIYAIHDLDPLRAIRSIVVSKFPGDPVGTLYAGGYDADNQPAHNTNWVYRGLPPYTPAGIVFAGLPGRADCVNESVSALTRKYPGLDAAAADLKYPDAKALDDAILEHCK